MRFERHPAVEGRAREVVVETPRTKLSGLLAEPADGARPRALVVAVHGAGMHAGYFHPGTAPELSLLETGSRLGFTVWAPDRPGIGASADLPDDEIGMFDQARLLLDAIDTFAASNDVGAGVFLIGHSYGLKVSWTMAADPRGADLLGVDGAGSGARYAFPWGTPLSPRDSEPGPSWGPPVLYPPGTFSRRTLPLHRVPRVQAEDGGRWPDDLRSFASRIRVPLRLTLGEHERFWPIGDDHQAELRALFCNAPRFTIEIEPNAAHNISLGWTARTYHLKALAFAETCITARRPEPAAGSAGVLVARD